MLTTLSIIDEELLLLAKQYGVSSNSYLSLYANYETFYGPNPGLNGAMRYLDCRHAWVGAAEPLTDRASLPQLLKTFGEAAKAKGKVALIIPVAEGVCRVAQEMGYSALPIGVEPKYDFSNYNFSSVNIDSVRRLLAHGASVREIRPEGLSVEDRAQVETLIKYWLDSRKIAQLGFLNQVRPWELSEHKKYFGLFQDGQVFAFVAAVPALASGGWYLVDCFRGPNSPTGSIELLYLEAMKMLKAHGARWISQGVAPLAISSRPLAHIGHRVTYNFLKLLYSHGDWIYNFDSLYRFKLKFKPTALEPSYLLIYPPRIGRRVLFGIIEAFICADKNPVRAHLKHFLRHRALNLKETVKVDQQVLWLEGTEGGKKLLFEAPVSAVCCAASMGFLILRANTMFDVIQRSPLLALSLFFYYFEFKLGSSFFLSSLAMAFLMAFLGLMGLGIDLSASSPFSFAFVALSLGFGMAGVFIQARSPFPKAKIALLIAAATGFLISPNLGLICVLNFLGGLGWQSRRFVSPLFLTSKKRT